MNKFEFYQYLKTRSEKLIEECKQILGGKCVRCGSAEDLQFDHIDPKTKKFYISRARSISREKLLEEVKKCQLLCRKCHIEKGFENKERERTNHGKYAMYFYHKCRCDICREYHKKLASKRYYKYRDKTNKKKREKRKLQRKRTQVGHTSLPR